MIRARWPIARLLPLILGCLILAAVLPVVFVGYFGTQDVARRLLRDRGDLLSDAVVTPIESLLTPVSGEMDVAATMIADETIHPADPGRLDAFMQGLLASTAHVSGISLVAPDGTLQRWSRGSRSTLTDDEGLAFRQRLLDQFRDGGNGRWSAPFASHVNGEIVFTYRSPIRRDGRLLGLLTAAVSVSSISGSLEAIGREFELVPFVLADRLRIVAHPAISSPSSLSAAVGSGELPRIDTIGDPVLAAIWKSPQTWKATEPLRRAKGHWTLVNGESYTYVYRDLPLNADEPLLAGFYFQSSITRRDRWMAFVVAGIGIVLLAIAGFAAARVGRSLARPLTAIGEASAAIGRFDFRDPGLARWETSRVDEVASTASAIGRTAQALAMFERYMPKVLVHQLLSLGKESSLPGKREMSILFLDLEGFTRFSAGRGASEVADYLNRIFARVGPIIEEGGGTIDKYTGDGLMAFWGAPLMQEQHARKAVDCAFHMANNLVQFMDEERRTSRPVCRVRIGVHSGEVVVGDLGYGGRMNYTVVGDTVNIAKRTEEALRGVDPDSPVVISVTDGVLGRAGFRGDKRAIATIDGNQIWLIGRAARLEEIS